MPLSNVDRLMRFITPSVLGVCMFLIPFPVGGAANTFIGHIKQYILMLLHNHLGVAVMSIALIVSMLSLYIMIIRPSWVYENHIFSEHLACTPPWFIVRVFSLVISSAVVFGLPGDMGDSIKFAEIIVVHIVPRLVVLVTVLSLTAPLLLDFGLVQFAATFASRWMEPLFKVPGRSAVDCVASWLGSSSMAIVITDRMHLAGHYSDREAAVMVSSFSLAGIYNIYALAAILNMNDYFFSIVTTVYVSMFVLAMIMPRLWPLNRIPDTYMNGTERRHDTAAKEHPTHTVFQRALIRAEAKAEHMTVKKYLHESLAIALPLIFGTIPLMISLGTFFMALTHFTPIVDILSAPIVYIFEAANMVEPEALGTAAVFAFIDPFLAVTFGQVLLSPEARYICVAISAVGLINLTEVVIHVWHTEIPLTFMQMLVIYFMRIIFSLFIIIPAATCIFG